MSSHVPIMLRRLVVERANGLCEYCLIHEDDTFLGCEIEHIIAEKHGGPTAADNLAYACVFCNRFKGTDIASLIPETGELCRLFHPRTDRWTAHFRADGVVIRPLTDVGQVTIRLLNINAADRLLERETLQSVGRYPSQQAVRYLGR